VNAQEKPRREPSREGHREDRLPERDPGEPLDWPVDEERLFMGGAASSSETDEWLRHERGP
jgi:hypothetical protein